jgi:type IV pilus assembly protein PilO
MTKFIILSIITFVSVYYFDTQYRLDQLKKLQLQEQKLRQTVAEQQVFELIKLKKQLKLLESTLTNRLDHLLSNDYVASIQKISKIIQASDVKRQLFQPLYSKETLEHSLYMKLPIRLRVIGNYHQFAKLVSRIAVMDHIVTQQDVHIRPNKDDKYPLILEITLYIYRSVDLDKKVNRYDQTNL